MSGRSAAAGVRPIAEFARELGYASSNASASGSATRPS
jgi:hypothetical protein